MENIGYLIEKNINVDLSISYFGSIEFYNEALKSFINTIDEKIVSLNYDYENEEWIHYNTLIVSLKSESYYLGFSELANVTLNIERLIAKNDIELIDDFHKELLNQITIYKNIISNYFDNEKTRLRITGETLDVDTNLINKSRESIIPIIKPKVIKEKILIVDDSMLIIKLVNNYLSKNYEVISAMDGEEAIKILSDSTIRKSINLCLLDLNMPKVDGYQVLDCCVENNYFNDLPIVVISGIDDTNLIDKVNSYPVSGILIKPFKEQDLLNIVKKVK